MPISDHSEQIERVGLAAIQDQLETVRLERDSLVQKLVSIELGATRAARSRRGSKSIVWLILAGGGIFFTLSIAVAPWLGFTWTWCGMLCLALATVIFSYKFPTWERHLRAVALAIVVGVVGIPVVAFLMQESSCRVIEAVRWAAHHPPPSCSLDMSD